MEKISLSGAMFGDDILKHLSIAVEVGYNAVELRGMGPLLNGEAEESFIREIEKKLEEGNLKVPTFSTWLGGFSLREDDKAREYELERCGKFFELARRLNCPWVRVNASRIPPAQSEDKHWKIDGLWMSRAADMAKDFNVGICIEMHHGTLCDTKDHTLKYLELIERENVGIILDPYNLYQVPTECDRKTIESLAHYIINVHVKDIIALTDNSYPYAFEYEAFADHAGRFIPVIRENEPRKRRYFANRMIGSGGVDWYCIFSGLKSIGYKGYFTIEATNGKDPSLPDGKELAKKCYEDLRKILKIMKY